MTDRNRSRRGGRRTPSNPAPVSGPGTLSRRTDGGPSQPVRELPAEATGGYGTRQAHTDLQGAAPMAAAGDPAQLAPGGDAVWGPTQRTGRTPGPPARVQGGPRMLPEDPDMILRAMYAITGDPHLLRLMGGKH